MLRFFVGFEGGHKRTVWSWAKVCQNQVKVTLNFLNGTP